MTSSNSRLSAAVQIATYDLALSKPKFDADERLKGIRNRLRKYNATSIVDLALSGLWAPRKDNAEAVRYAPWLSLVIVKWALQDPLIQLRTGPAIPVEEFDSVRQALWELPGQVLEVKPPQNVLLMVRSLMHVQIEFQRPETWGFLRWPALYAQLPQKGHNARQQFRDAMGVEPTAFLDLAFALYAQVISGKMPYRGDVLAPYRSTYGADVDKVLELFTRDLVSLRAELRKEAAQKLRGVNELHEFPYLKRFPLLTQRDGTTHCWHRLVFARGIEEAVHIRLSEQFGAKYSRSFSKIFEQYVTALAADTGVSQMPESEYKDLVAHDASAVEVILDGEDCNIFVEAKMSLFADDVLIQDSQGDIYNKTERVRDAIEQGWKVGKLIRQAPRLGTRFHKNQDFLLVVTSRELLLGSGSFLQQLYVPGSFDYPDGETASRLPLTNVFVLSIEDYEHLIGCMKAGEVNLSSLLKECAEANKSGATARLVFSHFLEQRTKKWTMPTLLQRAQEDLYARAFKLLDPDGMKRETGNVALLR